ncbi:hypothetical protein ACLX1H_008845 [Fusarium chlamydosporum]
MSNQSNSREIPSPFNTPFYIPIEKLNRGPNGRVYDPNQPLQTVETTPQPDNSIEFNRKVDKNWQANVSRVIGPEFAMRWGDMNTMDLNLERWVHQQCGGHVVKGERWNMEEIEKAGRLLAWGVRHVVIEALVGWPSTHLNDEERAKFHEFVRDELALLEKQ